GIFDAAGKPVQGPVEAAAFETPARLLGLAARSDGIDVHLLVRRPLLYGPVTVTMGPGLSDPETKFASTPRFAPSTTVSAAVVPAGLLLTWRSRLGPGHVLWAWSGRSRWPLANVDEAAVAALAPTGAGAAAAWTAKGRVDVLDLSLADTDGDHVPDLVDLCSGPAETHDGTLDHDGCPDPPEPLGTPLEARRVWLPDGSDACTWVGQAGQVLGLSGGGRAWIGAGALVARDAGGVVHAVELAGPGAGDAQPEPRGLFALPGGRIAVLTSMGVAVVDSSTWAVAAWLLAGKDLWAGSWDADHGILVAGSGGTLFRLADVDDSPEPVTPPSGVAKDRPVSVLLGKHAVIVAWQDSGAFHRKGWTSAWTPLEKRPQDDPAAAGTRRLVRSAKGEIFLVTGAGALLVLEAGAWRRVEAGLEGVWVRDAFVDPDTGQVRVIAVGGRPLILSPHEVDRRIVVASKHFKPSGTSVKKSIKAVLGSALGLVKSGKRLVRIEGYTDSKGGTKMNLALSLKRAEALASWLADQGADPRALAAIGFGEAHPVAKPSSTKNRRVEVVLLLP
ncbi:MAG: OmpA family protein, partial [Deltaproteobacteria bacterium]|nr:OmpA family protein [Deltaproteobacteria bacterium]